MANWADLAKDNRLAAFESFQNQRWRTFISRAYYATYSAATDALIQQGVVMPKGRNNPPHGKLPELVGTHLTRIAYPLRWRLAGAIKELYRLRIIADYIPAILVEEGEARAALSLMKQAFRFLRGES